MKYLQIFIVSVLLGVALAAPISDEDVGEYGDHFEGDIVLTEEQSRSIGSPIVNYNGLRELRKRWPDRTIVYHINEEDFGASVLQKIRDAIAAIEGRTCLRFRERQNDEHAVIIQGTHSGCFSNVGLTGGRTQTLNLGRGCYTIGTIIHEMLHTIGFFHMQSTHDRDNFVTINRENIIAGKEGNFHKYTLASINDFGVAYDYGSVMHYSDIAFSKNGKKTIVPVQEGVEIGQRRGLSDSDVTKLNKMYCEPSDFEEVKKESN